MNNDRRKNAGSRRGTNEGIGIKGTLCVIAIIIVLRSDCIFCDKYDIQ